MKKILFALAMVICMVAGASAQTAVELAKQKAELNEIQRKSLNAKPSKEAKKQAKQLKKEGWKVPVGERALENQIMNSFYIGEEQMADEDGSPTPRFITHTALATAGSYNTAFAAARANAQSELAALMGTKLAAALQLKLDNNQMEAKRAITNEKLNERMKATVQQNLTNALSILTIYKEVGGNSYQVQTRLAFDKKELSARLKRALRKELEQEGDELNEIVDDLLKEQF